jgi:hypothetical protein
MANGWTNKGLYRVLEAVFNGGTLPTSFYLALVTSAVAPDADTNTLSQLTEIAAGNGYTSGGIAFSKNATDFPGLTEDDGNNRAADQHQGRRLDRQRRKPARQRQRRELCRADR